MSGTETYAAGGAISGGWDNFTWDQDAYDQTTLSDDQSTTTNLAAIATWKKIAKRLKNMTVSGATVVNPKTGAMGPAKEHRFSEGATRLGATGMPMLTITGLIMRPGLPVEAE